MSSLASLGRHPKTSSDRQGNHSHGGNQSVELLSPLDSYFPPAPLRYFSSSDSVERTSTDFASIVFSSVSRDFKNA